LEEHGLDRYVDPRCIRRELAEATDMTEEELDAAAHELMQARGDDRRQPPRPGTQYYEHMGGYSTMHEMHDYNPGAYPHGSPISRAGVGGGGNYPPEEVDDDMVYVTTL
jgi:hypothetical protein